MYRNGNSGDDHFAYYASITKPDYCEPQFSKITYYGPDEASNYVSLDETNYQLKIRTDIPGEFYQFSIKVATWFGTGTPFMTTPNPITVVITDCPSEMYETESDITLVYPDDFEAEQCF